MEKYILLHKNDPCAVLGIDEDNGALTYASIQRQELAPFLGGANVRLMKKWWEARAVPGSRRDMEQIIRDAGCINSQGYLAKNLALSLTDTYWICPSDMDLHWSDVSLYSYGQSRVKKIPYHNATSYDPNASLGGQMDKYWDLSTVIPELVKNSYRFFGQQSLNELLAAEIHRRQGAGIPYVNYTVEHTEDGGISCRCQAFTSDKQEFVSAYEVLSSEKISNSVSGYDAFIQIGEKHGVDHELLQNFMDYQTAIDFVISNTDRHLNNFGLLRDTSSLQMIGPAPVFDCGNSMFYADLPARPYSRAQLLSRKITSFHDKEEKMLRHIRNKQLVRYDLLPEPGEISDFYERHGVPSSRAEIIAGSYANKLSLFRDFQQGKTISFYQEKKVEQKLGS